MDLTQAMNQFRMAWTQLKQLPEAMIKGDVAELKGVGLGALISFGLGIYIVAYVVLDAALAVANKTGFSSTLNTLVTTVAPILIIVGVIWLIYKKAGIQ